VVETITAFARRVYFYRLTQIDKHFSEEVEILSKVALCLEKVMQRLRKDHRLRNKAIDL